MPKFDNLTGVKFGRLTVISRAPDAVSKSGFVYTRWNCLCDCGKEKTIYAGSLKRGVTVSCGCQLKQVGRRIGLSSIKHGGSSKDASVDKKIQFQILQHIRQRARANGYETDLELSDIPEVPDVCPVLGIKLKKGKGPLSDFSVSIDKINPNLPYLKKYKNNLRLISYRANRIKNDATIDELEKIILYIKMSRSEESENLL